MDADRRHSDILTRIEIIVADLNIALGIAREQGTGVTIETRKTLAQPPVISFHVAVRTPEPTTGQEATPCR